MSLVSRNGKIGPRNGQEHDDFANAAVGALYLARPPAVPESHKPTSPVLLSINPTSPAMVNLHASGAWSSMPWATDWS